VYGTPTERFGGAKVIARLPSTVTTPVAVGDTQDFAVRMSDLKFFDRESGRRTAPRPV
jgi:multiple sugar transport system ATP-binding protein